MCEVTYASMRFGCPTILTASTIDVCLQRRGTNDEDHLDHQGPEDRVDEDTRCVLRVLHGELPVTLGVFTKQLAQWCGFRAGIFWHGSRFPDPTELLNDV